METRANYILIGAFMLSAIVLTIMFALWLGSSQREYDEYDIIFNERVSGLSVGAAVLYNGIDVGQVRNLQLAPNDPNQVIARVRIDKDAPVKEDTEAELELVGVTGVAIIQLSGGSPASLLLKDRTNVRVPRIYAKQSPFGAILQGGGNIVASVQRLLSQDNTDNFEQIVADIEVLTNAFVEKEDEIKRIVDNVALMTDDGAKITAALADSVDKFDALVALATRILDEDFQGSLDNFDRTAAEVEVLVKDLQDLLVDNREAIDAFAQQGLGEAAGAVADTRRLIRSMDSIMREIERDPTRFFFGDTRPEIKAK